MERGRERKRETERSGLQEQQQKRACSAVCKGVESMDDADKKPRRGGAQ
jgi:hypothetical protein